MTTDVSMLADWNRYLVWVAKENSKIERRNAKKWDEIKVKQAEDKRLSDVWEADYQRKRDARDKRVEEMIRTKEIKDVSDLIRIPYPSFYNPYKWILYFPMTEPLIKPVYEDFLTMLTKGQLTNPTEEA